MSDDQRLARLEAFVGEWRVEVPAFSFPPELADAARTTFEWTLGGAFLLQQATVPVPEAPDGLCLIGLDAGDGYTQHYFDSRGIARVYAMTFDGRVWTLERRTADFTPLQLSPALVRDVQRRRRDDSRPLRNVPRRQRVEARLRAFVPPAALNQLPAGINPSCWSIPSWS